MHAITLLSALFAPQDPATARATELRAVLVEDRPVERERAVAALVQRLGGDAAQWTEACAAALVFAPKEPGPTRQVVPLRVLDVVEDTEVFLYVPAGYDPGRKAPLLLWGHGAGGTGAREYLQWQAVADRIGMFVLAITEFGKAPGWGFTPRERAAQLAALRWAKRTVNVDDDAVFVGGCSRGGHMTWDLMLRHPDLFAGALPCIGGPRMQLGAQNNLRYLENVVHLPIRDLQGSEDDRLLLTNLRLAFARLQKFGAKDAVLREFPDMGHAFDLAAVDWAEFFTRRRVPVPDRVVRVAAERGEMRAAWVRITACTNDVKAEAAPQVDARQWQALDEAAQRALLLDRLASCTARLAVRDRGKGRFTAEGRGVQSFELLLTDGQIGADGAIEVVFQGRAVKKKVKRDATLVVQDFAERLDRSALVVARVGVP